jgi:predicted RNA-binding protein
MLSTKVYLLPPIRADTPNGNRELLLIKKRLKTENLNSRRNDGKLILEGKNNVKKAL